MHFWKTVSLVWLALAPVTFAWGDDKASTEGNAEEVSFTRDVAPLLVRHCTACHSASEAEGGYQLETFQSFLKEGDSELPPVVAGNIDESYLVELLAEPDADLRMPRDTDALPDEQIALIRRWIAQGAQFDGPDPTAALASIIPKSPHPDPPESYRVPVPVTALAFAPSGKELAVGGYHEITIWNPADGTLLRRIKNLAQRTYGLAYSPDGSRLAAASGTPGQLGEIVLFDPATGDVVQTLGTLTDVAFDVAFSPDGTRLAACGADRSIRVYDVASGEEMLLIEDHADWVMAVAFNHDGSRIASASRDKTSKVFEAATGQSQATYSEHGEGVYAVAFNEDGTQVMTAGRDKKIHVWNPADAKKIADVGGFGGEVYELRLASGHLFGCSADKTARQFRTEDRGHVLNYEGHQDYVFSLAYHPATERLATGCFDGEVRVWNVRDGATVTSFLAAPGYQPPPGD